MKASAVRGTHSDAAGELAAGDDQVDTVDEPREQRAVDVLRQGVPIARRLRDIQ